jgi:hypothetical protein
MTELNQLVAAARHDDMIRAARMGSLARAARPPGRSLLRLPRRAADAGIARATPGAGCVAAPSPSDG